MAHIADYIQYFPNYYEVVPSEAGPIVACDDWTMPIDEVWHSYVVYPQRKCPLCGQYDGHYPACIMSYIEEA